MAGWEFSLAILVSGPVSWQFLDKVHSLRYNAGVYADNGPARDRALDLGPPVHERFVGLQGRLTRPLWGSVGIWAVLCGALASNRLYWRGQDLLSLALVLLMAELGWGSLWDLSVGVDWFRLLRQGWPPTGTTPLGWLPYTHPSSPAGRLVRGFNRLTGWWRGSFWPAAGPAFLSWLGAAILACIMALLLPQRLYPLQAAAAAVLVLGAIVRYWGKHWLAGQALFQVGLGWMAGHMTFARWSVPSLALALIYSLVVWGAFRATHGLAGALWMLNLGQMAGFALLVWHKQPLAAGLMGLFLLTQIALQVTLRLEHQPERFVSRSWPWVLASMLVAVLFLP